MLSLRTGRLACIDRSQANLTLDWRLLAILASALPLAERSHAKSRDVRRLCAPAPALCSARSAPCIFRASAARACLRTYLRMGVAFRRAARPGGSAVATAAAHASPDDAAAFHDSRRDLEFPARAC